MKFKKVITLLLASTFLIGCDRPGENEKPVIDNETCEHKWSNWETINDAKCNEKGLKERYCTVCNKKEEEEIPEDKVYGHAFIHHDQLLPSYFYDGNKEYWSCQYCKGIFNLNKIQIFENEHIWEKAGDDVSIALNGVEKGAFTLLEKNLDTKHVTWKLENLEIKNNDVISLVKTGDVYKEYGFHGDSHISGDKKSLIEGTFTVNLEATANGFQLSIDASEPPAPNAALVAKINGERHLLNKVTYYDLTTETYIYGYHNFNVNDTLIIDNEITSTIYDYEDLADDTKWNVYDFHKGTNNEIVFDKAGRYGIEFDKGGDGKISITKAFAPASEGDFDIEFENNAPNRPLMSQTFATTSEDYKSMAWYVNHEAVINNSDLKAAIANGITFYSNTLSFKANDSIRIANVTDENNITYINAEHLTGINASENAVSISGNYIKFNKDGTYAILYIAAFDSIYISEYSSGIDTSKVQVVIGETRSQYSIGADNTVTIPSAHYDKNTYIIFYTISGEQANYLQYTLDSSIPSLVSQIVKPDGSEMRMIYIYSPGTFTITLNLTTMIVSMNYELDTIEELGLDPTHRMDIILNYMYQGSTTRFKMLRDTNGAVAYLNNFIVEAYTTIMGVSIVDYTINDNDSYQKFASTIDSTFVQVYDTFAIILVAGEYNITFDLTTCTINIVPAQ